MLTNTASMIITLEILNHSMRLATVMLLRDLTAWWNLMVQLELSTTPQTSITVSTPLFIEQLQHMDIKLPMSSQISS